MCLNDKSKVISPNSKDLKINSFDLIIDAVGNEKTRQIATQFAKPGSVIIHAGLTNSDGTFDSRKITLQEISFIGTYCYTTRDFQNTINFLNHEQEYWEKSLEDVMKSINKGDI